MKLCLRTLRKQSHWLLLGLVILLTLYMDVYVARNVLDGDVSDFLYCGNIFAREKDLFSTNYYYSTEVRPLDLSSVFSFFFLLTGQWTLVRVLGTITVQTIYALTFLFMTRQAGLSRKTRVTVAALSLLPFSIPYARIVLYHLYYTLYLANMFFIIGLTLWTLRRGKEGLKQALLPAVLLGLLWIFVGLNGIRHMLLIGIPLLVGCIVELLRAFRKAPWVYGKPWRQQALLHTEAFRLTLLMIGSCLCFLAGFVVNQHVLLPYYGIVNSSSAWYAPIQTAQRYADIWNGWLTAIGVRNSALSLVGIRGFSLAAALVSFVWLLYRSVCFLRKGGTMEQRLLGGLYALSMFSTTLVFVFDSGCRFLRIVLCAGHCSRAADAGVGTRRSSARTYRSKSPVFSGFSVFPVSRRLQRVVSARGAPQHGHLERPDPSGTDLCGRMPRLRGVYAGKRLSVRYDALLARKRDDRAFQWQPDHFAL